MSGKLSRALIILLCLILCAALSPAAFAEDEAAPVTVVFDFIDESALPGLYVADSNGNSIDPAIEPETDMVHYGCFLLLPGDYQYYFHDENGRYEDFDGSFTVEEALKYIIPLDLTPIIEVQALSFSYINPVYSDQITEEDLPLPAIPEEALIAEARHLSEQLGGARRGSAMMFNSNSGTIHTNVQDAGVELKSQVLKREAIATIRLSISGKVYADFWKQLCADVFSSAITHTGAPTEGDYIRYEFGGYNATGAISYTQVTDTTVCTFKYALKYFTTAEQESELDAAVMRILASLSLEDKSDYQKISAIYDYLCTNVAYGGSGDLKYTAYSALMNNIAYCQGYSTAFYRLCLSAGIDTRIISSSAMTHAWNIAALDGSYYALDSTWDHNHTSNYIYFLKGSDYWHSDHMNAATNYISEIGDQYKNVDFASSYPLPRNDYGNVPQFDNVSAIPVDSIPASLKDAVIDLESYLTLLAMHMPNGADDIDSFLVSIVYSPVSSDTNASKSTFDVAVSVAAYRNNKAVKRTSVAQSCLSPDYAFSFTLPVPDSWAGKEISYTRTGGGFSDDTGILTASDENVVSFSSIAHIGRFTLYPVKYSVSFETNGGSTVTEQSVVNGDKAAIPVSPTKDGYWFTGWYADSGFTTLFDFDSAVTADTTVYARWAVPDFVLPSALSEIGAEAFSGGAFTFAVLPDNAVTVGPLAFADCDDLLFIYIPASVEDIDSTAFGDITGLTILGASSETPTVAETFSASHGYAFVPLSK